MSTFPKIRLRETTSRYSDAVDYARKVFGDLSQSRYRELHSLSQTLSRIELRDLIDTWATKKPISMDIWSERVKLFEPPKPQPGPQPELPRPQPSPDRPCVYFGGDWLCPKCQRMGLKLGVSSGVWKLAQDMYEQHRKFVLDRMHKELTPYTNGKPYELFADVELEIWHAVAARIGNYRDQKQPLAWLKTVVHSVVTDHFKREWATKRGAAVTGPLVGDVPDSYLPAQPTRPAGAAPDTRLTKSWDGLTEPKGRK